MHGRSDTRIIGRGYSDKNDAPFNVGDECESLTIATLLSRADLDFSVGSSKQNRHPPHPSFWSRKPKLHKGEPVMLQAVALSPALDGVRQQQWLALA